MGIRETGGMDATLGAPRQAWRDGRPAPMRSPEA